MAATSAAPMSGGTSAWRTWPGVARELRERGHGELLRDEPVSPDAQPRCERVREELAELAAAPDAANRHEEFGDLLARRRPPIVGISGNLMSLGAVDFGLIIDGAVVICDLVVADPGVVALVSDADDPTEAVVQCLRVGAQAISAVSATVDTHIVEKRFDAMSDHFDERVDSVVEKGVRIDPGIAERLRAMGYLR